MLEHTYRAKTETDKHNAVSDVLDKLPNNTREDL